MFKLDRICTHWNQYKAGRKSTGSWGSSCEGPTYQSQRICAGSVRQMDLFGAVRTPQIGDLRSEWKDSTGPKNLTSTLCTAREPKWMGTSQLNQSSSMPRRVHPVCSCLVRRWPIEVLSMDKDCYEVPVYPIIPGFVR